MVLAILVVVMVAVVLLAIDTHALALYMPSPVEAL